MNLLYLVYNRVERGTYWRAFGFARELARRGHHVTLLASARQSGDGFRAQLAEGVNVIQMPDRHRGSGYDLRHMRQRISWLRGQDYDIVHAFEMRPTNLGPALYLQRNRNVRLVSDWCDWFGRGGSVEERSFWTRQFLRPIETFFEEQFRPHAAGVTVINSVLRARARALGLRSEQILLLPNGAAVDEIQCQDRAAIQARLGLSPNHFYLAYTGAMFRRDAELMARAFDLIHSARPETRLLLIGYSNIPIEMLVRAPEAVVRTGQVSFRDLADYVAAADIGWLPLADTGANRGRFPMKAHDFMAAGRPLVVTDLGDLGDLVRQRGIGAVAGANPVVLAETVLALMTAPDVLDQMGRRARRVAESEFAWPVVTDKLIAWYSSLKR